MSSYLYSQTPCPANIIGNMPACGNIGCDFPGNPWNMATESVEIPEFPGCIILLRYCFKVCNNNPYSVQVYVHELQMAPWQICCPQCQGLADIMMSGSANDRKALFLKVWEQLTQKLYSEHVQWSIDQGFPLSSLHCPNNKVEYTVTQSSCIAFCATQVPDGSDIIYKTFRVECMEAECCLYKKKLLCRPCN